MSKKMSQTEIESDSIRIPAEPQRQLWLDAVLLFVIADLVSTLLGLRLGAVETAPVGQAAIAAGVPAMLGVKLAFVGALYAAALPLPSVYRTGVPVGLALWGGVLTCWNTAVLVVVVL